MRSSLPYAPQSDTSREAATRARGKAEYDRERLCNFIRRRRAYGSTRQEAEDGLGMDGNTLRPRWYELEHEEHCIVFTGRKRPTRSGCPAEVYVWVPPETRQMELGV